MLLILHQNKNLVSYNKMLSKVAEKHLTGSKNAINLLDSMFIKHYKHALSITSCT